MTHIIILVDLILATILQFMVSEIGHILILLYVALLPRKTKENTPV